MAVPELTVTERTPVMMRPTMSALLAAAIALSGCGSNSTDQTADSDASVGAGKSPPGDWNAADACSVIDKEAMAGIVGQGVVETQLGYVSQSDGASAVTSECTYQLADNEGAKLMLRWFPIGDNSEGAINLTRNSLQQTVKAFGGEVETIDGLGKAAFWDGMGKSLNVFIGEDKFAIITMPSSVEAKDRAVMLARKLGA